MITCSVGIPNVFFVKGSRKPVPSSGEKDKKRDGTATLWKFLFSQIPDNLKKVPKTKGIKARAHGKSFSVLWEIHPH